jgi:nucleoside-diphosphate-sugar epimerase
LFSRTIVLRLAGIYGPGRIPRLADLVGGKPIPISRSGHLNLIHVDDAASVILAAERLAVPPRVYVVSDGHPTTRRAFYEYLADLRGLGAPAFTEPLPGTDDALRGTADKRVNNARMLAELGIQLAYPSYREGLAAI